MPIVRNHNAQIIKFEAELDYSDLSGSIVNVSIPYGSLAPEFFVDINNSAIKTLIENQDSRLFEVLIDLHHEAKCLLDEQIAENKLKEIENRQPQEVHNILRPNRIGYIYLVKSDQYFKIGCSKQPNVRFEQIGLQLPFPFEVLHIIPADDMFIAERELHLKYAHQHSNGEWFKLSQEEVNEIMSLSNL